MTNSRCEATEKFSRSKVFVGPWQQCVPMTKKANDENNLERGEFGSFGELTIFALAVSAKTNPKD